MNSQTTDETVTIEAATTMEPDPGITVTPDAVIDVHLDPDWRERALRNDVAAGLTATPKSLPPKWFYDEVGSELFDDITRLEEYYPTERERSILVERAGEIANRVQPDMLIELGSGTSDKTRVLLDALTARGLDTFVPFDVSEAILRSAALQINDRYPELAVHAVVGDFEHHLPELPSGGRRLLALLGGTIGNFEPVARAAFLSDLAEHLSPGDALLLGTDLVKDIDRLELAYDDPAGVTAAFNRNVLHVINRELDGDFDPEAFDHVARFDTENEWIDLGLRAREPQTVHIGALDLTVAFAAGELLRTEISAKFRPAGIRDELAAAGFELAELWTDPDGDYGLSLSFVVG